MSALPLASLRLDGESGLLTLLRTTVSDPRKARGIRHNYLSVHLVGLSGVLAEKRSYEAISRWARDLSQSQLKRLGCRWSPGMERFLPPANPRSGGSCRRPTPSASTQSCPDRSWPIRPAGPSRSAARRSALLGRSHGGARPQGRHRCRPETSGRSQGPRDPGRSKASGAARPFGQGGHRRRPPYPECPGPPDPGKGRR